MQAEATFIKGFGEILESCRGGSRRREFGMPLSVVGHAAVIAILIAGSWLVVDQIHEPDLIVSFLAVAPPPPPPPPPPPLPPPGGAETPKPKPVEIEPAEPEELVQPTEMPEGIPEAPEGEGDEGVEGGVPGGVPGGVAGGVIGGVVGGVLGGVLGGVPGGVPGGLLGETASKPLVVAGDVRAPVLLRKVKPEYPDVARRARITGTVILQAVINEEGAVESVEILRSKPLLDQAAIDAVSRWRYRPATQNGRPVKVYFTVVVEFSLT